MGIVLCDVDGPLADLHPEWLRLYNRDWDDHLSPGDVTAWEIDQFVKPACGKRIYDYLRDPFLYDSVAVVPGALEGLRAIRDMGHRLVFLTAANEDMVRPKARWLMRHRIVRGTHAGMKNVVFAQDKSLVMGDVLIDDYPVNLLASSARVKILWDAPHNRSWDNGGLVRVHAWDKVVATIRESL